MLEEFRFKSSYLSQVMYLLHTVERVITEFTLAQAVSHWPLTAEARIRALLSPREICGGQVDTGTDFLQSSSVFTVNIIPP
jgi:hypothetical protein